ncbi:MAG: transketolase C-terminal domain-containing protein [Candidatus Uhrbacteria bacterium]
MALAKHLNRNLFTDKLTQVPTRDGYGTGLVAAGKDNPNVVALCCDLTESTRTQMFRDEFPDRFIEVGIAEQNMSGLAAGMANYGKVPFTTSYAVFSPGRSWDQLRVSIAYNEANVKTVGAHAGISVGPDGATHQALEDLAITRVLPGMVVLAPCDVLETEKATIAIAKRVGPTYLRFGRTATPVITTPKTPFRIGHAEVFREGSDATVIACGPLVYEALLAAECLNGNAKAIAVLCARYPKITQRIQQSHCPGHSQHFAKHCIKWTPASIRALLKKIGRCSVEVINCPSVKPIDSATIVRSVKKTGRAVTVEEHQITGGLFGAVAELLAQHRPTPITPIGMPNSFGESGEPMELLEKYGMTAPHIIHALAS